MSLSTAPPIGQEHSIHYLLPWKEIVMSQKTGEFNLPWHLYIRTTLSLILLPGYLVRALQ